MAKATIAGTDTVNAALETKCNANFTELYNMLTGAATSTLLTPTIASFANATHTHANPAGGGATIAPTTITTGSYTGLVAAGGSFGTGWNEITSYEVYLLKDPMGFVHLRGMVLISTGSGTTVLTLPSGYRPVSGYIVAIPYNDAGVSKNNIALLADTGALTVGGGVTPASPDFVVLDSVTFKAA